MSQTAIEKIVNAHGRRLRVDARVHAGDFVTIRPTHLLTRNNTLDVIRRYVAIAGDDGRVLDPQQPVFAMDPAHHGEAPPSPADCAEIEAFAARHGVDYYPPSPGPARRVMIDEGYVTPGSLCVVSDTQSNVYGAIAACCVSVVRTDAAAIWATGETWWQIPEQARVVLEGRLPEGATGGDVIHALLAEFADHEVFNCCVEFTGSGVAGLSVEDRMTIAGKSAGWGALSCSFPFDEVLRDWLLDRSDHFATRKLAPGGRVPYIRNDIEHLWGTRDHFSSDDDAFFSKTLTLRLGSISSAQPAGGGEARGSLEVHQRSPRHTSEHTIVEGFSESIDGRAVFLPSDGLSSDAISGDDAASGGEITDQRRAACALLGHDPAFQQIARPGDIIVGGRNFGAGPCRERAAAALVSKGIRLVIAASVCQTFTRDAFNNGLIVIECPGLTDQLKTAHAARVGAGTKTIAGPTIRVDFRSSSLTCAGRTHPFAPFNRTAQELVTSGGSASLIRATLAAR